MSVSPRSLRLVAAVTAAFAAGALAVATLGASTPVATRVVLAAKDNPVGGKGRTLGLTRATIPAGAALALHHHPGTEIAFVARGELTYTVRSGNVAVMHGAADGSARVVRRIRSGQTGPLETGDWIVEQPTMVHRAVNKGS